MLLKKNTQEWLQSILHPMSEKNQPFIQHSRKNKSHGLAENEASGTFAPISELLFRRIKVVSQSWQWPEIKGTL